MASEMFVDVCIPKENESEFIKIAHRLGTKGLLFLYPDEKKEKEQKQKILEIQKDTKIKLYTGLLILKNTNKPGITFAKAEQQNIENRNLKFLFDFEEQEEKDSFHYRRSGANQVLCNIMKDKNKVFVLDMEKIITSKQKEKLIGRMIQNLMLIKKYKLDSIICSFSTKPENLRAEKEYSSLIRALGYEEIAKRATEDLHKFLEEKDA
jgi:RNase P/RNase MRP subunit p30